METAGVRRLNRSSPSCLNTPAQRTDFFHGLLVSYPSSAPHNSRHGPLVDFVPTGGKLSALAYATVSLFDVDRHWSIGPRQERVDLCHVFPGRHTSADVDEAETAPGYAPLVLLRARYMIAGFGISNGNIGKSYESLYRGFKTYYSHKRKELDDLDLAFVFCVQPGLPHLARFCSQIETDVHFYRKFVVPLEEPLAQALACLPFLGLPQNLWVERRAGSPRQTHSVPVCSPPSRRVAPLRPRCAGLTAWTPAARTSVPALV